MREAVQPGGRREPLQKQDLPHPTLVFSYQDLNKPPRVISKEMEPFGAQPADRSASCLLSVAMVSACLENSLLLLISSITQLITVLFSCLLLAPGPDCSSEKGQLIPTKVSFNTIGLPAASTTPHQGKQPKARQGLELLS